MLYSVICTMKWQARKRGLYNRIEIKRTRRVLKNAQVLRDRIARASKRINVHAIITRLCKKRLFIRVARARGGGY